MLKTWVVNMDRNPDRMEFIKKQLDGFGISFERFSGIDGTDYFDKGGATLRKVFSPVRSLIAMRKKMTEGQLGAALSHNAVYRKMVEGNVPAALIFEDDSVLSPAFPETLKAIEKVLDPAKPQVYVLNTWGIDVEALPPGIHRAKKAWCTDGYVITLAGAKLMLEKNEPVIVVCDAWKRFARWWGLELNVVNPAVVRQADELFASDIQVRKKIGSWFVRQLLWIVDFVLIKLTGR